MEIGRGSLCFAQPQLPPRAFGRAFSGWQPSPPPSSSPPIPPSAPSPPAPLPHVRHHEARDSYNPAFASIIVDGNSGATLQPKDADGLRHPASLTKIMTLYLLFERLESGKMKLDTEMDVSEHASEQAPTKLGLRPGQTLKVEDAIKGLVTRSANDAAVVIAEAIGGDEDDFAKAMTRKARALGMTRTVYRNASGLPDDDQVTTARDQATLGRAIQDRFPRYYRYFSTTVFNFRGHSIAQPQPPDRQRRRRRRHQDRLHPRLRLQPRDLDAPRQPPSGRRGAGRPQRRFARRHHAQPAGGKPRKGLDPTHRGRDHRAQRARRQCRCRRRPGQVAPAQTVQVNGAVQVASAAPPEPAEAPVARRRPMPSTAPAARPRPPPRSWRRSRKSRSPPR